HRTTAASPKRTPSSVGRVMPCREASLPKMPRVPKLSADTATKARPARSERGPGSCTAGHVSTTTHRAAACVFPHSRRFLRIASEWRGGRTSRRPPSGVDAGGAEEGGVAEAEDAAVGAEEPVAGAGRRRSHGHDGRAEVDAAGAAVERCAEGEDATVGSNHAVAAAAGGGADHRGVEPRAPHAAEEGRVAEAEDAAVAGHQPVAAAAGSGGDADHRRVEVRAAHAAEEGQAPLR